MSLPRHSPNLNRWIADLGAALARASQPDPRLPNTDYRDGTTLLACTVEPDGRIADIRIAQSCGLEALDRRAVAKLRRADPLPIGPAGAQRRTQMIAMPVAERVRLPFRRTALAPTRAYA